jgi:hypothetical protein
LITTSNFKLCGRHPSAVSIANGQRGYWHVPKYKPLVPPRALVQLRNPVIFAAEYAKQLARLNPQKIVDELGPDAILLCWEAPGEYCHRRIVAHWLETELGLVVPERIIAP